MKSLSPDSQAIVFNPVDHSYTIKQSGKKLAPVTSFIGGFFPKFDVDYWAPRTAKKRGVDEQALRAEWEEKARIATEEGTLMHAFAEFQCKMRQNPMRNDLGAEPAPTSPRCEKLFRYVELAVQWLFQYYAFLEAEKIVFSQKLGLAGTIDLVMARDHEICLFDWKQNKQIRTSNPYQHGLGPLSHLEDHELNKYSLQLNIYKRILQEEKYYPTVDHIDMKLIHITEDGFYPMYVPEMNDEVSAIVKQHTGLFPDFM